jgi:hypothetical protein
LDCGAEASLINGELFNQLMEDGVEILTLPISNCVLEAAFGAKSRRITKQALLQFSIDSCTYEVVALVAPSLSMEIILGVDFLKQYRIMVDFEESYFETRKGEVTTRHNFARVVKEEQAIVSTQEGECGNGNIPTVGGSDQTKEVVVCPDHYNNGVARGSANVQRNGDIWHGRKFESGRIFPTLRNESVMYTERGVSKEMRDSNPKALNASCVYEIPVGGKIDCARRQAEIKQIVDCTVSEQHMFHNSLGSPDARSVTLPELQSKAEEAAGLSNGERDELFKLLLTYKEFFSSKPGKCTLMNYCFEVKDEDSIIGYSRPIPFAVNNDVRLQIERLLTDGIIEPSNSPYINPL